MSELLDDCDLEEERLTPSTLISGISGQIPGITYAS